MRQKLAAGNWKMHGEGAALAELRALADACPEPASQILICPPATLIARAAEAARGTPIHIGAQDCHAAAKGAHTGDLSVGMLADAGANYVIVGHSERRADHGENDAAIRDKAASVIAGGLTAILCLGESLDEREAGQALDVVGAQLRDAMPPGARPQSLVLAYEPVWAIGTGHTPTTEQIAEVHGFLRTLLAELLGESAAEGIRILYGGSVKAANAAEIFAVPNVDGALVGGASLTAADFAPIVQALDAA